MKEKAHKKGIKIDCEIKINDLISDVSKLHAREIKKIFRNEIQTKVAQFIASGKKNRHLNIKVLDKKVHLS